MNKLIFLFTLIFPGIAFAQNLKCEKGFQPYNESYCISQRMASYIACVDTSGKNQAEINEVISEAGAEQTSGDVKVSGGNRIIHGSLGISLDEHSQKKIIRKLERKFFSGGMNSCLKALDQMQSRKSSSQYTFPSLSANAVLSSNLPSQIFLGEKLDKFQLQISNTSQHVWSNLSAVSYFGIYLNPKSEDLDFPKTLFRYPYGETYSMVAPGQALSYNLSGITKFVFDFMKGVEIDKTHGISGADYLSLSQDINVDDLSKAYFSQNNVPSNIGVSVDKVNEFFVLSKNNSYHGAIPTYVDDMSALFRVFVILKGNVDGKEFRKIFVVSSGWAKQKSDGTGRIMLADCKFISDVTDLGFDLFRGNKLTQQWQLLKTNNSFRTEFSPDIQELNKYIKSNGRNLMVSLITIKAELKNGLLGTAFQFIPIGEQPLGKIVPMPYGSQISGLKISFNSPIANERH